ncbi:pyridoxamine 5'-phosphate oxidase family protein [Thermoleophilia bacterium SCSIO 60948]|nr:pyridoxamine 5'-phosphate oxidase family protein [Thermoleophilia bacterium SCSIO 60948]
MEDAADITTEEELRALVGEPVDRVRDKDRPVLSEADRIFLAASPMCLIATSGPDGRCDVSPRGDPPGFAQVIDERTIALPERAGNRRADSHRNILANPQIGTLFLLPGRGDTLRINGRARLVRDPGVLERMVVKGHRPKFAIRIDVETVFFHCAKAFMRSELWNPDTWNPEAAPTRAQIAKQLERPGDSLEELERYYDPDEYRRKLYAD